MNKASLGWVNGFIGMVIFSGSLPATRLAVAGFDPVFLTAARAVIAGLLALGLLLAWRQKLPARADLLSLAIVALGVVIGFPLLTALALQKITSAHSVVFIGLLPLATAIFAVWRGAERPRPIFWLFAGAGSACVAGFALSHSVADPSLSGDLLMLAAVTVCGLGYAEGAKLSRVLGGWQVISWALVLSLPVTVTLVLIEMPVSFVEVDAWAWGGLAYVSLFIMLIGFVFWYSGLAQGGTAAVGQLQLLQPFFSLLLAAGILHEPVSGLLVGVTAATVACVLGGKRFAG